MPLLDKSFHKTVRSLYHVARHAWGGKFLGLCGPRHFAAAAEFTDWADYRCGDDYRYVDWNACARHDELLSKKCHGNEDQRVDILIDCSASMALGTPGKLHASVRIGAALASLACLSLHRVGVAAISDRLLHDIPPSRATTTAARLLEFLEGLAAEEAGQDLPAAIREFVCRKPRQGTGALGTAALGTAALGTAALGTVVLISDFLGREGVTPALETLRRASHEVHVVQVYDGFDAHPRLSGAVDFLYVEGHRKHRDYVNEEDLVAYREEFEHFTRAFQRYCAYRSIGLTRINAALALDEAMLRIIRTTSRRPSVIRAGQASGRRTH